MIHRSSSRWKTFVAHPTLEGTKALTDFGQKNADVPPTAVLVFHGVGEEVRYGTLGRAASMILLEAESNHGAKDLTFQSRTVLRDKQGSDVVARGELSWMEGNGTRRQVHVYEAYWAPLTVGKVSYLETVSFLLSAGWNGLRSTGLFGKRSFDRWLFGGFKPLAINSRTPFLIVFLMFLVVVVGAIIAMAASAIAGVLKASAAGGGGEQAVYAAADFVYRQIAVPCNATLTFVGGLIGADVAGQSQAVRFNSFSFSPHLNAQLWWQAAIAFLLWGGLIYLGNYFKFFLTQYAGSLVAYLSPYKDSKWEELRSKIQQVGLDAARLIHYGHEFSPWIPQYRRIIYLGHSLGSVIAYDTLNTMINLGAASTKMGEPNAAVHRTRGLITFGSPLDKTAFLFRIQLRLKSWRHRIDECGELRETMVSAIQPLIASYDDYRFVESPMRGVNWVNIWSPRDIISGSLDYYDDPAVPESAKKHVRNIVDPDARIPIASHVQYWNNQTLRSELYNELF